MSRIQSPDKRHVRRIAVSLCLFAIACLSVATLTFAAPVRLTMFANDAEINKARIAAWKEAYPEYEDVTVDFVIGQLDKAKVLTAGGVPPDIIFQSSSRLPNFVYHGLLMDLGPFIQEDPSILDGLLPDVVNTGVYKGKQYGLPSTWSAAAVLYNADMLAERGVAVPDDDWNWDDLVSVGKKVTFDGNGDNLIDHFGFGDRWINKHRWPYWVWAAGGEFYNADLTESRLDEEKALRGLEFYASLYLDHHIAARVVGGRLAEPGVNLDARGGQISKTLFSSGRMAFSSDTRFSLVNGFDFTVGVLPPPKGPEARTAVMVANFYGIHPDSEHPDVAWSLVKFLLSEEGYRAGAEQGGIGALPAHVDLARAVLENAPEERPMNWIKAAEDARRPDIYHPAVEMIETLIDWNGIMQGKVSVRQAVLNAVEIHNAELKQAWEAGPRW